MFHAATRCSVALGALTLSLLASAVRAQAPWSPIWVSQLSVGGGGEAGVRASVVDSAGVTYVTGSAGTSGNEDIMTAAFAPSGSLLWSHVFNGVINGHDQARGMALVPGGSLWVTGNTPNAGLRANVLLLEYDAATGVLRNTVQYASNPLTAEIGASVAVDPAGNVFVAGDTVGDGSDGALLKFDAGGTLLWRRTWDGPAFGPFSQDHALEVLVDPGGNPVVLFHGVMGGSQPDYVVVEYASATGVPVWTATWGTRAGDYPHDLEIDAAGDVYVSGIALDTIEKFGTVKLRGTDGTQLWQAYDVIGFHPGQRALALDGVGGVYVTGSIDPDGDQSNNNDDFYTVKYDAGTGARLWTHSYGASCIGCLDLPSDLVVDAGGHVLLTGRTSSPPYSNAMITFQIDSSTGAEQGRSTATFGANRIGGAAFLALDAGQSLHGVGQSRDQNTGATDLVALRYPTLAGVRAIGSGCAGSGALPLSLSAVGVPGIPSPSFAFALADGPAAAVHLIAFGFQRAPSPVPFGASGCFLHLDVASIASAFVVLGGALPFPIPPLPALVGMRLEAQGAAADTVTGQVVTSNALTIVLGV